MTTKYFVVITMNFISNTKNSEEYVMSQAKAIVDNIKSLAKTIGQNEKVIVEAMETTQKAVEIAGKPWIVYSNTAESVDVSTLPDGAFIQTEEAIEGEAGGNLNQEILQAKNIFTEFANVDGTEINVSTASVFSKTITSNINFLYNAIL